MPVLVPEVDLGFSRYPVRYDIAERTSTKAERISVLVNVFQKVVEAVFPDSFGGAIP
jgi:hypothetical protein